MYIHTDKSIRVSQSNKLKAIDVSGVCKVILGVRSVFACEMYVEST